MLFKSNSNGQYNLSGPSTRKVTKKPVVGSENSNSSRIVESKTAKAKVPDERAASIPEDTDNPDDLYEEDGEDMEIIHMRKDRHGRLVKIDTPIMSEYEKIRERAIAEREALWKKQLEELRKDLNELAESNGTKRKRGNEGEESEKIRPKKKRGGSEDNNVSNMADVRRSSRARPQVNYCLEKDETDPDWVPGSGDEEHKPRKSRARKRTATGRKNKLKNSPSPGPDRKGKRRQQEIPFSSINGRVGDEQENERMTLRPKKAVNYCPDGPPEDEFIFCVKCRRNRWMGCQIRGHEVIFDYEHNFEVGPSKLPNAGRGIFNNGIQPVPEGVMVSHYAIFVPFWGHLKEEPRFDDKME